MSGQTWTPAPKRGAIPLHPMTFGMLLGKAFAALRHNPKVLFGFAVTVQLVVVIITTAIMTTVLLASAQRLESVPETSPDYPTIVAGTIALNLIIGAALALASVAFTAVVQGVVAADVSFAAVGRAVGLRALWNRMKPAFWRLWVFALLQGLVVVAAILLASGIIFGLAAGGLMGSGSTSDAFAAAGVVILALLGVILVLTPLVIWLSTKLLLVPSILVIEHATLRTALVRSWRLTRGRFWPALGVMFLIGAIMGLAAQVVGVPGTILSMVLVGIFAPTGAVDAVSMITVLALMIIPQILVFAVQAITLVVQATGGALIYLDSRMRYEGLDQALLSYTERSSLGVSDEDLGDPYRVDPERAVSSAPPPRAAPAPAPVPGYGAAPGYGPPPGYGAPGQYGPAGQYGTPGPPYAPVPAPVPPPPAVAPPPQAPGQADSTWAPPGGGSA